MSNTVELEELRKRLRAVEQDKLKLDMELRDVKKQKQSNGVSSVVQATGDSSGKKSKLW